MNTLTQEQAMTISGEHSLDWYHYGDEIHAALNAAFALGVAQERQANKRPPLAYAEIKMTVGDHLITHLLTKEEFFKSDGVALIGSAERCARELISKEIT